MEQENTLKWEGNTGQCHPLFHYPKMVADNAATRQCRFAQCDGYKLSIFFNCFSLNIIILCTVDILI